MIGNRTTAAPRVMVISIIILIILYLGMYLYPGSFIEPESIYTTTATLYIILNAFYLYEYKRENLFCFEFLFAIAYFLCCFLGPLFFNPNLEFDSFTFPVEPELANKTYIVSLLGYLFYMLGVCLRNNPTTQIQGYNFIMSESTAKWLNYICLFFIGMTIAKGGTALLTLYSNPVPGQIGRFGDWGGDFTYALYSYVVSIVANFSLKSTKKTSFLAFLKSLKPLFIFNTLIIIIPLVISGLRSSLLQVVIPLVLGYSLFIRKIPVKFILIGAVAAFFMLSIIGLTRQGDVYDSYNTDTLSYLRDFGSANFAEAYFVNYSTYTDATGGSNMLFQVLSVVPFLQSIMLNFIDVNSVAPGSSRFFTDAMNVTWGGIGTNMIGDLIYSFGITGMLIAMFVWGAFLRWLNLGKSPYRLVMLLMFTGNAIFAPRVEYSYVMRSVSFAFLLLFVVVKCTKPIKYKL